MIPIRIDMLLQDPAGINAFMMTSIPTPRKSKMSSCPLRLILYSHHPFFISPPVFRKCTPRVYSCVRPSQQLRLRECRTCLCSTVPMLSIVRSMAPYRERSRPTSTNVSSWIRQHMRRMPMASSASRARAPLHRACKNSMCLSASTVLHV